MPKIKKLVSNVDYLAGDWKDTFSSRDLNELLAKCPGNTLIEKFACDNGTKMMISCPEDMSFWLQDEENVEILYSYSDPEEEPVKALHWNGETIMIVFKNENVTPLPITDGLFHDWMDEEDDGEIYLDEE